MNGPNPLTRARKKHALEHFQQNRLQEAKTLYAQVCQLDKRDADAWKMLGAVHGMLGEYADAETCCRRVIELAPKDFGTCNNLGNALKFQNKLTEAEDAYRQAIRVEPRYAEAYNNLGNLMKEGGREEEAEAAYRRAIFLQTGYAEAYNNLGSLLKERGKLDEAAECYMQALRSNNGYADAFYNLGMIYRQQKALDKALPCFRQAVQIRPDHVESLLNLGSVLQEQGVLDEAKQVYQRVVALQPESPHANYMLATLGAGEAPARPPEDSIAGMFDSYADNFDHHLVGLLEYHTPEKLFAAVKRVIPENADLDVLDLGCGTGLCGALFRNMARRQVGVDLSPKMLDKARERGVYDDLLLGDVMAPLIAEGAAYDLIVSADVFIYLGDLQAVFESASAVLRPGGLFAFSTETGEEGTTYALRTSARYAQSVAYIRDLARQAVLVEVSMDEIVLRQEAGQPMAGNVFVFRK